MGLLLTEPKGNGLWGLSKRRRSLKQDLETDATSGNIPIGRKTSMNYLGKSHSMKESYNP